jgi:hypothetical protein
VFWLSVSRVPVMAEACDSRDATVAGTDVFGEDADSALMLVEKSDTKRKAHTINKILLATLVINI